MGAGSPDFVVIGSGPNGLVAACTLARAGLRVLVLEAHAARPGGAVWSEPATEPGFLHDVGAAFFPFGRLSPAFRELDLVGHGLVWRDAEIDSCHPAGDESVACIARTEPPGGAVFGSRRDEVAWRRLRAWYARIEPRLLDLLLGPVPAVPPLLRLPPADLLRLGRTFLSSGRALSCRLFDSEAARRVVPGLALHVDVAPDDRCGAAVGWMLALTATTGGFVVPQGGARAITETLLRILAAHGGALRLGARAVRVHAGDGRVRAVETADGSVFDAHCGVLADTAAAALLLDLVERRHVPRHVVRRMQRFPQGWGTFKVDWALAGPVPWRVEPARRSAVVHVGDSVDELAEFSRQVRDGRLPERPYLVVGQQSLADPTRAPDGRHTLWAYSHVPARVAGGWATRRESFTDRVEGRIEALAPGFRERILARRAMSPDDLAAMDANLVGGDIGGGSNAWRNQLVFRPVFPYFRYRMPLAGLYLCSSYAHPGAGVHGMCGYNAAARALRDVGSQRASRTKAPISRGR